MYGKVLSLLIMEHMIIINKCSYSYCVKHMGIRKVLAETNVNELHHINSFAEHMLYLRESGWQQNADHWAKSSSVHHGSIE